MEIKNKLTSDHRGRARATMGERSGKVKSRNMYLSPMDKDTGEGGSGCGLEVS